MKRSLIALLMLMFVFINVASAGDLLFVEKSGQKTVSFSNGDNSVDTTILCYLNLPAEGCNKCIVSVTNSNPCDSTGWVDLHSSIDSTTWTAIAEIDSFLKTVDITSRSQTYPLDTIGEILRVRLRLGTESAATADTGQTKVTWKAVMWYDD